MSDVNQLHLRLIEALLFASANPMPEPVMAERLQTTLISQGCLRHSGNTTRSEVFIWLVNKPGRSGRPDLGPQLIVEREVTETIACCRRDLGHYCYHQPITRAEVRRFGALD